MQLLRRIANRSRDALFAPPLDRLWRGDMRGKVTCLLYHRVGEATGDFLDRGGSPIITAAELERDLILLRGLGARFLTFEDLRNGRFPKRDESGVIISFDDCFACNYTIGAEVLERLGIRATFFQTSALVDADELLWEHELYWHAAHSWGSSDRVEHLREEVGPEEFLPLLEASRKEPEEMRRAARALYPTSEQVRAARKRGHEIGSHGHHHYKRINISAELFDAELRTSSEKLAEITGEPIGAFSYPFNSHVDGDEAICARYFEQAATVDKARIERDTDPLSLPRFTWPGAAKNGLRQRRWILTGTI